MCPKLLKDPSLTKSQSTDLGIIIASINPEQVHPINWNDFHFYENYFPNLSSSSLIFRSISSNGKERSPIFDEVSILLLQEPTPENLNTLKMKYEDILLQILNMTNFTLNDAFFIIKYTLSIYPKLFELDSNNLKHFILAFLFISRQLEEFNDKTFLPLLQDKKYSQAPKIFTPQQSSILKPIPLKPTRTQKYSRTSGSLSIKPSKSVPFNDPSGLPKDMTEKIIFLIKFLLLEAVYYYSRTVEPSNLFSQFESSIWNSIISILFTSLSESNKPEPFLFFASGCIYQFIQVPSLVQILIYSNLNLILNLFNFELQNELTSQITSFNTYILGFISNYDKVDKVLDIPRATICLLNSIRFFPTHTLIVQNAFVALCKFLHPSLNQISSEYNISSLFALHMQMLSFCRHSSNAIKAICLSLTSIFKDLPNIDNEVTILFEVLGSVNDKESMAAIIYCLFSLSSSRSIAPLLACKQFQTLLCNSSFHEHPFCSQLLKITFNVCSLVQWKPHKFFMRISSLLLKLPKEPKLLLINLIKLFVNQEHLPNGENLVFHAKSMPSILDLHPENYQNNYASFSTQDSNVISPNTSFQVANSDVCESLIKNIFEDDFEIQLNCLEAISLIFQTNRSVISLDISKQFLKAIKEIADKEKVFQTIYIAIKFLSDFLIDEDKEQALNIINQISLS